MQLGDCTQARIVDVKVDDTARDQQCQCCVQGMCKGNPPPGVEECLPLVLRLWLLISVRVPLLTAADDSFGVLHRHLFDNVGNEEMKWGEAVESQRGIDISVAEIRLKSYQQPILFRILYHEPQVHHDDGQDGEVAEANKAR